MATREFSWTCPHPLFIVNGRNFNAKNLRFSVGQWNSCKIMFLFDDAQKSSVSWSSTLHTCANGCTWRTKEKNQSKDINGVPAKNHLKVKLVIEESPRTQGCKSQGEFTYLKKCKVCGLYSGTELIWIPWHGGISL